MIYEYRRTGGKPSRRVFKVVLQMPPGATEEDVMEYIREAVASHKDRIFRDSPMFGLDRDKVQVKRSTPKYEEQR